MPWKEVPRQAQLGAPRKEEIPVVKRRPLSGSSLLKEPTACYVQKIYERVQNGEPGDIYFSYLILEKLPDMKPEEKQAPQPLRVPHQYTQHFEVIVRKLGRRPHQC